MTRSYRFGDFRLDPATRELHRGDAAVAVPPRAFDCIVYLIEQRERAVGRDELIAAVWGKADIGDGMLGQTVLSARRALEDTGKEQQFIRTVFRFGYHWVAAVEEIDGSETAAVPTVAAPEPMEAPAPAAESPDGAKPHRDRARRWLPLLAVATLLVAVAALSVLLRRPHDRAAPPAESPHAARGTVALVLPVTVNAGSGFDWVRLGLMDLIGARLRAAGLAVVPSDNVVALTRRAGGDAPGEAELARAAGASLVVDACAEALGDHWRVTLRTSWGRSPALLATGESTDALAAARSAADDLARQLGYAPAPERSHEGGEPNLGDLSQRIEAAILTDRLDEARMLISAAPPALRAQPEIHFRLAQLDYQKGDLDAAAAGFEAIAGAVSAEQDPILHARALTSLGAIAATRDQPERATRRFDEAIELLRGEHAADALGKALNGRANIAASGDRYDAALQDFAEARIAFESSGNLLALAVLDSNLGALDLRRLRYAEAEPLFARAAERFATFGMHAAELNALTAAAEMKLALLQPDAALAMEPRLRELVARVSDPARQRAGELTRAQVLIANGRLREAAAALATTLDAAQRADDRAALAHGHALAAQLARERGDPRAQLAEADAALAHFTATDDARELATTRRLRIEASLAVGDDDGANAGRSELARFAEGSANAAARLQADLAAADCAAASGDAAADAAYAKALAAADTLRIPLDLRDVAIAYADWLVGGKNLARAGAVAERIAGWAARDYASALLQLRIQTALGNAALARGARARAAALAGERLVPGEAASGADEAR